MKLGHAAQLPGNPIVMQTLQRRVLATLLSEADAVYCAIDAALKLQHPCTARLMPDQLAADILCTSLTMLNFWGGAQTVVHRQKAAQPDLVWYERAWEVALGEGHEFPSFFTAMSVVVSWQHACEQTSIVPNVSRAAHRMIIMMSCSARAPLCL